MFKLKKKNKLCRQYFEDIFGTVLKSYTSSYQVSFFLMKLNKKKVNKSFVFTITDKTKDIFKPRLSPYGKVVNFRKKLSFFYGGLRKKNYKKFVTRGHRVNDFNFGFMGIFELSLVAIVYRMHFCTSMASAIELIKNGYVLVNKEVIKQARHLVCIGDIVHILPSKRLSCFLLFLFKLRTTHLVVLDTDYLMINYESLTCIVYKAPSGTSVPFPFVMSLPAALGGYFVKSF
jgi:ribosomal protein S4